MKPWIKGGAVFMCLMLCAGCGTDTNTDIKEALDSGEVKTDSSVVAEISDEVTQGDEEEVKVVTPAFGGTLNLAMSPADTLDPLENTIANVDEILGLVFEGLYRMDGTLTPVPVLAESSTVINSGEGVEITLKDGVLFHDGTQLTASDVVYTINALRSSETSPYKPLVAAISRAVAVDSRTVRINYDVPYAFALNDLTFPIVSKSYRSSGSYDPMVPVGTGPYRYVDYQLMQHLDLTAFEGWHGGDVYIENVHVIDMNEDYEMETLFDQNLIDLMNPIKFDWLKYSEKEDQNIISYISEYCDFIGFNYTNAYLSDVGLRKAIASAIDKDSLIYTQFIDHAYKTETPVIPGSWFDTETEENYSYDIVKAKSYLDTTVYQDHDGDGFYDTVDGTDSAVIENISFRMLVNQDSTARMSASKVIEKYIESLGFEVTVEAVDAVTYKERIAAGDYDMIYGGWKLTDKPDYMSILSTEGTLNYFGYSSEEMNIILKSIMNSPDSAAVVERVEDFKELFLEELPFVPLYFIEGAVMTHGNVYGEINPAPGGSFNRIEGLYLDLTEE